MDLTNSAGSARNINTDSVNVPELIKDWRASAIVSSAPFDPEKRLEAIIKRVKEEYSFDKPEYKVDAKCFEKVEEPDDEERLLFDSLCKTKVVDGALNAIDMSFYEKQGNRPILLRSCYFDLFELILDSLRIPRDNHRHLILGSPGIGKSWFHVFCLYVLVKADVPVFIQRKELTALFFKGEAYRCRTLNGNRLLRRTNIWHLYDRAEGPTGIGAGNIAVMVSSPDVKAYKEYAKTCHFGRMFMPLWSFAELTKANLLCLPASSILTEVILEERYQLCGGIARHIFDDNEDYLTKYEPPISSIKMKTLVSLKSAEIHKITHQIFGLNVHENYFKYEIAFLSNLIADKVIDQMNLDRSSALTELLKKVLDSNTASLCGKLYERMGIRRLTSGFRLELQFLNHPNMRRGAITKIVLPEVIHRYDFESNSLDSVIWGSAGSTLWAPQNTSFPCIDCLLLLPHAKPKPAALGFQFTVSPDHPILQRPLNAIIELCRSKGFAFKFIFVLSKTRNYADFVRQHQKDENGRIYEVADEIPCSQYKIKMF